MPNIKRGMMGAAGVSAGRTLWSWGRNYNGILGHGVGADVAGRKSSPTQIGEEENWSRIVVSGTYYNVMVSTDDGKAWVWGDGAAGGLGLSHDNDTSSPVQLGALTDWPVTIDLKGNFTAVEGMFVVKPDNTLWIWGHSEYGRLGFGLASSGNWWNYLKSSPVQLGSAQWASVASFRNNSLAVRTDGTAWAWGRNGEGQLGQGNTVDASSPVQIGSLTNWASIATGSNAGQAFGIKTDGTLWSWGDGEGGGLGHGTVINYSSPTQVGSLTNWASVKAMGFTFATKTDGTMWSWGLNYNGRLAQGHTIHTSSPVQVGSETYWSKIQPGMGGGAITTGGKLFTWADNAYGQLGQGDLIARSSPTQVGTETDWIDFGVMFRNSMFGIRGT